MTFHSYEQEAREDAGIAAVALLKRMVAAKVLDRTGTAIKAEAETIIKLYDAGCGCSSRRT